MDLISGAAAPGMVGAGAPEPGGPAPGPGGADLAALLGGGPTPGVDNTQQGGSELDALDQIAIAIDAYIQIPTVEESERLIAEKMKTMVQQLKASNEKMADQVSGGSPAQRKAIGA
jgi:hypothetical protein